MTSPRPGGAFHLDLDGIVIAGRYIDVDPPHHMVIEWDRARTDHAAPAPARMEFFFTPTGDETTVQVRLSGLGQKDAVFYSRLFAQYLDRIAVAFPGRETQGLPRQ